MLEKRGYNGQQDIHLYRAKKGLQDQHCKPHPPPQHPTTLHYEKYLLPHFLSLQHENKIITNESKGYQNYDPKHKPTLKLIT